MKSSYICLSVGLLLCTFFNLYSNDIFVEGRAAYFYPTDATFRNIYHQGSLFNVEASCRANEKIYPWVSMGLFNKSGQTVAENTKTRITIIPLGLGFKYQFCWKNIKPYLGMGVLASYLYAQDDSPFVVKVRNKWGAGVIGKFGLMYDITDRFFADFYFDYSWTRIDFNDTTKTVGRTADISGIAIGVGLGFRI